VNLGACCTESDSGQDRTVTIFPLIIPMTDYEKKNRQRLITLLSNLPSCASPDGWKSMGKFAVGGLTEIGFSKSTELLLVISSSGRWRMV
jgi:hypothetical protein